MNNIDILEEKEKEALRNFKGEYETCNYNSSDLIIELDDAKIILNLIEKQSKEIEQLNKSDASKEQSSMNYYNLYKELVDKIKAKIEYNKTFNDDIHKYTTLTLEELLGKE